MRATDSESSEDNPQAYDMEDNFEPSLFAEHPLLPDDVQAAFLATNLLLLYLNLARLSSVSVDDAQPQPVTTGELDIQNR